MLKKHRLNLACFTLSVAIFIIGTKGLGILCNPLLWYSSSRRPYIMIVMVGTQSFRHYAFVPTNFQHQTRAYKYLGLYMHRCTNGAITL